MRTWLLAALPLLLAGKVELPHVCYPAELVRAVDGDTLEARIMVRTEAAALGVSCEAQTLEAVRLADVRAPERHGPDAEAAEQARLRLEQLADVEDLVVCPRLTRAGRAVRSLGRLVGDVRANGQDLGAQLIGAGLARPGKAEGW